MADTVPEIGTQPEGLAQEAAAPQRAAGEFLAIAAGGLVLVALIALGSGGLPAPLAALRVFLGAAYVLFLPGYALQAALFPRAGDLDGPERLALSFGLSVAIVPLLAVALHVLPWGLRLWPIAAAEGLTIAAASLAAWWRRRRLPPEERFAVRIHIDLRGWWAGEDRTGRILYGLLAVAVLVAAGAAAAILLLPRPADHFTEFYALGKEGLAEDYPREAAAGRPVTVTLGIANREGVRSEYRVEVLAAGQLLAAVGPVALDDGQVWEQPVEYALPLPGDDQAIDILLYRDGGAEPYRRLELWIDIVEEQE
jgi:uncharacterized membrane protein